MHEKLKSWLISDHIFYSLLVVGVGLVGFLLGGGEFRTKNEPAALFAPAAAVIPDGISTAAVSSTVPSSHGATEAEVVVASKTGTKYHLPNCPGASQIKVENRLEFSGRAAAEAAGYKPAANCPGLVQ